MIVFVACLLLVTDAAQWYLLNPRSAFTAGYNYNDYNNGACNGGNKNAAFMRSPYITTTSNSVKATVTGSAVQTRSCIYQHTQSTCSFSLGLELQAMEFDYVITGDTWSNWFAFWVNSYNGGWVPEAEIDPLEGMTKGSSWHMSHNFAGYGHEVDFHTQYNNRGHVTCSFANTGSRVTDCAQGSQCDVYSGDAAYQNWSQSSVNAINNGQLRHHLVIDYWFTWLASSLEVSNIWLYGVLNSCSAARPMERLPQLTFNDDMFHKEEESLQQRPLAYIKALNSLTNRLIEKYQVETTEAAKIVPTTQEPAKNSTRIV